MPATSCLKSETLHNRLNAHMNSKFKLAPTPAYSSDQEYSTARIHRTELPSPTCGGTTRVAICNPADDQALCLQTRGGEDDSIYHPYWNDCVDENAEKKKKKKNRVVHIRVKYKSSDHR